MIRNSNRTRFLKAIQTKTINKLLHFHTGNFTCMKRILKASLWSQLQNETRKALFDYWTEILWKCIWVENHKKRTTYHNLDNTNLKKFLCKRFLRRQTRRGGFDGKLTRVSRFIKKSTWVPWNSLLKALWVIV